MKFISFRVILTMFIILLMANSASATSSGASGFVPRRIEQGSEVSFSASVYNLYSYDIFIQNMYVTFTEGVIAGSTGDPETFNLTKAYPEERQKLPSNSSFSDIYKVKVDFEPGTYNVSIYFQNSNTVGSSTLNNDSYAIINATTIIVGVSDPLKFIRGLAIFVGLSIIVVLGLIVYNNKVRK